MKKLFPVLSLAVVFAACGGGKTEVSTTDSTKVDSVTKVVVDSTKKDSTKIVVDSTKKDSTKK
jgi:hypothetical protein